VDAGGGLTGGETITTGLTEEGAGGGTTLAGQKFVKKESFGSNGAKVRPPSKNTQALLRISVMVPLWPCTLWINL
jgi:hypothetical protein